MPEELQFRGIEKDADGMYRAVYSTHDDCARIFITEQEFRNPNFLSQSDYDYTLGNRKEAIEALEQANLVEWPEEIDV
jgi:hypothetical protein